jgi:hypothetical protein
MFAQLFCSFLFLFAASLFGTIISQVNEIVAQHASMSKELDRILEMYLAVQPRYAQAKTPLQLRIWGVDEREN